jgi:hypothetical protein
MFANSFRRIALAQGLLPAAPLWPPPGSPPLWGAPPEREAEPADRAAEPCEDRDETE